MTLPKHVTVEGLSGERFRVIYHVTGADEAEAHAKAEAICLEQTVEFPGDLVPPGDIYDQIVGQIEAFTPAGEGRWAATISYANEAATGELPQLLNVIFGNTSIKPGVRVMRLDLPASLLAHYRGPRFGQEGLRARLGVKDRPLLMTALKPMGLSPAQLGEMAYNCAVGGIDLIKDDHGLANQPFSTFQARVEQCTAGVAKANQETGMACAYMPNVTAPAGEVIARARFAKETGAGALLMCPGLVSFDMMRQLADDDTIDLPISSHPAFYGSFVTSPDNGFSHYALYGQIQRLAGADSSIYPNFGGRFSFRREECERIVAGCEDPMGHLKPIFATPGGGMNMDNIPTMREVYGDRVIYLVGGGLHRHSDDLVENARFFRRLLESQ